MPFDGNGNYQLPAGVLAESGEVILSEAYNTLLADLASALSTTLLRNGSVAMTGALLMGNQRIRSVGNAVADSDAMPRSQITTLIQSETETKVPRTSATGAMLFPNGTTAQRDDEEDREAYHFRYNTTLGGLEYWDTTLEEYVFLPSVKYRGEAVSLNGNASVDVDDIPEWCTEIEVEVDALSFSGTNDLIIEVTGSVSGKVTSGYLSGYWLATGGGNDANSVTNGFAVRVANATREVYGTVRIKHDRATNKVRYGFVGGLGSGTVMLSLGNLVLASNERITALSFRASGVNTFDGGTLYPEYK